MNRIQLKSSRRFSNPPEHLGDDFPFPFAAQGDRVVVGVLRLQHNGVVKLIQAGNRQSLVAMPGDHDFSVQVANFGLGGIDRKNIAILNKRRHRTAAHTHPTLPDQDLLRSSLRPHR